MSESQTKKYQIKKYKLILKAYSPIHIWSGETLDKRFDAVEMNGSVYIIDIRRLIELAKNMNRINIFDNSLDIQTILSTLNITDVEGVARYKLSGSLKLSALGGSANVNKINPMIRLLDYKSYIPGSEVKGSIRTAILYYKCKNDPQILGEALHNLSRVLHNLSNKSKVRKTAASNLENKVLRNGKDIHYDLLRSLIISDLYPSQGDTNLSLGEILLLTPRLRRAILLVEYIDPSTQLYGNIGIRIIPDTYNIDKNLLVNACREFSRDIIIHEKTELNKLKSKTQNASISNIYDQLIKFYTDLEDDLNKGSTIIRLGYGEGHFSTTIGLLLYGNKEFSTRYKTLLSTLNIKDPISRKVIVVKGSKTMPLGWARIELQDKSD